MLKLVSVGSIQGDKDNILCLSIDNTESNTRNRIELPMEGEEGLQILESLIYNAQFCIDGIRRNQDNSST